MSEILKNGGVHPGEQLPRKIVIDTSFTLGQDIHQKLNEIFKQTEEVGFKLLDVIEKAGWEPNKVMVEGSLVSTDGVTAIKEPLDNAVVHGNGGVIQKEKDKDLVLQTAHRIEERLEQGEIIPSQIEIQIESFEDRIVIKITDGGKGFNWKKLVDPLTEENLMNSSGRGLFLTVQAFGKQNVKFNEAGNEITLTAVLNKREK